MTDKELRPLIRRLLAHEHPGAVLVEELPLIREKRADLAIVNDALWGYEIKSEHDRLDRLPEQVSFYDAVFDYCHVIVASKFVDRVRSIVPGYWGIMQVIQEKTRSRIDPVRPSVRNTNTQASAVIRLLWKVEAVKILRAAGSDISITQPLSKVWTACEQIPRESLDLSVRTAVSQRKLLEGRERL